MKTAMWVVHRVHSFLLAGCEARYWNQGLFRYCWWGWYGISTPTSCFYSHQTCLGLFTLDCSSMHTTPVLWQTTGLVSRPSRPVFIASSANVGYGLVKLVTSLDIRWMAGGVSSDFRIAVQLLSAPEKHVTVAVVAVVVCWGSRLVECSLTHSSRECASPSDIHLRFMNMTASFTGHSTTSVLQVLGREGCGYGVNKPPSCTLAWFTKW